MDFKDDHDTQHDWHSIYTIWEDFSAIPNPEFRPPGALKRQAAEYLRDYDPHKPLSKTDLRKLLSKAQKMKNSTRKGERARGILLEKQVLSAFNLQR